jgi:hypothetical protein
MTDPSPFAAHRAILEQISAGLAGVREQVMPATPAQRLAHLRAQHQAIGLDLVEAARQQQIAPVDLVTEHRRLELELDKAAALAELAPLHNRPLKDLSRAQKCELISQIGAAAYADKVHKEFSR